MPNRRSAISSLSTSSSFVGTATICLRLPIGNGADMPTPVELRLQRKVTTSEGKEMTVVETQTQNRVVPAAPTGSDKLSKLIEQYGCGPVRFTGTEDALYERHLVFDNVLGAPEIGARERFEAVARSVRDILSQRWICTENTYER